MNDFFECFKLEHGKSLAEIVNTCLTFENSSNDNKSIGQNARAALVRIGNENMLNSIRVRRFGITLNNTDVIPDKKPE